MLYFEQPNLMFIHIPKNAGQSIRNALEQSAPPSFGPISRDLGLTELEAKRTIELGEGVVIEGLGRTKLEHLPLPLLAAHLPETWLAIRRAKAFALVRQPRDRSFSALLQRLREYRGVGAIRADDPIVLEEARRVCEWLEGKGHFSDMEFIHFTRQIDYVTHQGERIVGKVLPINRIEAAAQWVLRETGMHIDVTHDHARREPKTWANPFQPIARYVGRNFMPGPIKRAIYPLWMNSGIFENASSRYGSLNLGDNVEKFIDTYYAEDRKLFEEAVSAANNI